VNTTTIRLWEAADGSGVIEAVHPGGRPEHIGPLTAAQIHKLTRKYPRVLSRKRSPRRAATAQKQPGCLSKPHNDGVTTLPRCPFPGCPIRYHAGPDRECFEHQNETIRAAADLGIDWMTQPPPAGHDDDRQVGP
jgi:hypothetical protein